MPLLIHAAGESDLLLSLDGLPGDRGEAEPIRAERILARRTRIEHALDAGSAGLPTVVRLLREERAWSDDGYPATPPPNPLLSALDTLAADPHSKAGDDLEIVVLGTRCDPPGLLDTIDIAQVLVRAVEAGVAGRPGTLPVRKVTALRVDGFGQGNAFEALNGYLGRGPARRPALVTWGSGASALALGAMTALSLAGLPWRLVTTGEELGVREVVNPLEELDTDPVAGVFVRWRLFDSLHDFATMDPPVVELSPEQRTVVREAVERRRRGIEDCDPAGLRAVVADALVRQDGTSALAVRRYIVSRYLELLERDRAAHPGTTFEDLLELMENRRRNGPPLGAKIDDIKAIACRKRPRTTYAPEVEAAVQASTGLGSYRWLTGPHARALRTIGNGSHRLNQPDQQVVMEVEQHLRSKDLHPRTVDGEGWAAAGLPIPPLRRPTTVLTVWCAGIYANGHANTTISQQLVADDVPDKVRDYLGVPAPAGEGARTGSLRISALVYGTDESRQSARENAELLKVEGHHARVLPIDYHHSDPAAVEAEIEQMVRPETGALLLVPVGGKTVLLTLIRAMRRVGARRGLPLFVRQNAGTKANRTGGDEAYLWPALTGGDLPLLIAARESLRTLELDVAWRLLAASAVDPDLAAGAQRLATAFACRNPEDRTAWPAAPGVLVPESLLLRCAGMAAQRIALVAAALRQATREADRIRLLVLAGDVLEASIAGTRPAARNGNRYREFREGLKDAVAGRDAVAVSARVLLLLNAARDKASVTHGDPGAKPDDVVAEQARNLAEEWRKDSVQVDDRTLPQTAEGLLDEAVTAAVARGLGQAGEVEGLLTLRDAYAGRLAAEILRRTGWGPA